MFRRSWKAFVISWAITGILLSATVVVLGLALDTDVGLIIKSPQSIPRTTNPAQNDDPSTRSPEKESHTMRSIFFAIILLVVNLIVLAVLNKMQAAKNTSSPAEQTSFQGNFKALGATLVVSAAGTIGSFLTLLAASMACIYIFAKYL